MKQSVKQVKKSAITQHNFDYDEYMILKCYVSLQQLEISPNQQLLAIQYSSLLEIFYLKKKIKINTVFLLLQHLYNDRITIIRFSPDSKYLLCARKYGQLSIFRADRCFKLVSQQNLHQSCIIDIRFINDKTIITCSSKGSIILSDFLNKVCQLKIQNAHLTNIHQIEFDSINQFIISCSDDKSLKYFKIQNGELFINAQNVNHSTAFKIYLIENNKQLISASIHLKLQLKLWYIDHQNQQLVLIRQFNIKFQFTCMFQLLNKQGFICTSNKFICLLDNAFKVLSQTRHNVNHLYHMVNFNNRDPMQYIAVVGIIEDIQFELNILKRRFL